MMPNNIKPCLLPTAKGGSCLVKLLLQVVLLFLVLLAKLGSSFTAPLSLSNSRKLLQDPLIVPEGLSRATSRKLQTCAVNSTFNACANCCGYKFADDYTIYGAVNAYNMDKATDITNYGEMKCWDVSDVTDMKQLLAHKPFLDEPIGCWDVSKVTTMKSMFYGATRFIQPIGNWNVSSVTDISWMFAYATNFNQAIGNWNVSRVTTLNNMFEEAKSFNQDISNWDVSKVTTMSGMFWRAPFNQDLCAWYNKLQGNPPVGDIFTTSACPVKTAPNFVDKTSFCWACSCNGGGQCSNCQKTCNVNAACYGSCSQCIGGACTAPTQSVLIPSSAEWIVSPSNPLLEDLEYTSSGVSFTLNFKTGKHSSMLQLLSQDCATNISALTDPVFIYSNPVIQSINDNEQSVSYTVRCNITSLKTSNIYDQSNSTNSTIIGMFCARVDLLDSLNASVSFLKNPVMLALNVTKSFNFSVTDVSAAETVDGTLSQGSVGLDGAISACVCDTVTFGCYNPVPTLGPFSILSVCVYSLNATAQIDQVNSLRVTQGGTSASLDSIVNAVPSSLTTLTKSNDGKTVCIQTQLYSNFFDGLTSSNKDQRKLTAQGNVQIKLSDGNRRLFYLHGNTVGLASERSTKQRESSEEAIQTKTSSFNVDQISVDVNPGNTQGPSVKGGLGLIVILVALAILAAIVIIAVAAKKKWTL